MTGKLDVFDERLETWTCFKERSEQYFLTNEVSNEKKVPAFLALIGARKYQILRDLCVPTVLKDKTFDARCQLLDAHFNPRLLVIAEMFRFYKREQQSGESVKDFNVHLSFAILVRH